jgi:hypothetical protein
MYLFQRMKSFVKKQQQEADIDSDNKYIAIFSLVVFTLIQKPFIIIRNYTIPMQEEQAWSRTQAALSFPCGYLLFLWGSESK